MSEFKIRPLHRRRTKRRKRVSVLNQQELAELLSVSILNLAGVLDELGWRYHRDSAGALWATPPDQPD